MGLFRHHHRTAPVEAAVNEDNFETHFLRYLRTFDGSKREFSSEVEALFDQLYDDNFYESKNETLITKDQVKQVHTRLFEIGSKVTLTHFKHKGPDRIDIKYRLENAEEDRTIHQLILTKDMKIIRAENLDQARQERHEEKEIRREEVRMMEPRRELRREERMMYADPMLMDRRELRREERMMYADPYANPYMMDPYADPYRRDGLVHDIRRDERMFRRI